VPHLSNRIRAVRDAGIFELQGQHEFDDVIEVVKTALDCPVAILSILDDNRQVFVAHVGLPQPWSDRAETPLSHSFCQHVVRDRKPLVVEDATVHDLLRDNLATRDLGVVSYLGVPIALPDGMVVGALAAIDGKPRAWSDRELGLLETIGRLACNKLAAFLSEQRWSSLSARLEEGILVGTLTRDPAGIVEGWSYGSANAAWNDLLGGKAGPVTEADLQELLAGSADAWTADIAEVIRSGTSKRFTRKLAQLGRWIEGHIQAIGGETFVIIISDATERMAAIETLSESENKLRLIVEGAKDYVIITMDPEHRITSWFGGAEETFGRSEADMLGRAFDEIFTAEDRAIGMPQTELAHALTQGVAVDRRWHRRCDGDLVFLDGTVRPLPHDPGGSFQGFIKVARNATAEKLSQDRQLALLTLGDRIRELEHIPDVAFLAAEIMARNLPGATRAGYGVVDPVAETVMILPDWRAPGMFTIAGLHHFRDYGSFIEDLKRGDVVIISDVTADARTAASGDRLRAIGISVLVNVPIVEHGAFVGVMFVHYDRPHSFTPEEQDFVRTIADRTREAVSRIRAEKEQEILNQEISHRLKNTMAMVQAIATQTLRTVADRAPVEAFTRRLHALSKAHEVLLAQDFSAGRMITIIESVLGQISPAERFSLSGPDLELGARTALSLALLMHELGTNALKYGAWSNGTGSIAVSWTIEDGTGEDMLVMRWQEKDGPEVAPPTGKGFGSRLIRLGLAGIGGVDQDYRPEGLVVEMRGLVAQLKQS
jgi:PAS domain S-box-containing protein